MSLLLDALKKAALEKQRREHPTANIQVQEASLGNRENLASNTVDNLEIDGELNSDVFNSPTLELTPEAVTSSHLQRKITQVSLTTDSVEPVSEELEFNIEEIEPDYLTPMTEEEKATGELPPVNPNAEMNQATAINTPEENASYLPETLTASDKNFREAPATTFAISAEKVQQSSSQDNAQSILTSPEKAIAADATKVKDDAEAKKVAQPEVEEIGAVARFDASSGKAALAELLMRSRKATDSTRKRMVVMYVLLSLTAVFLVLIYYYLLHTNAPLSNQIPAASISPLPPANLNADAEIAATATSSELPANESQSSVAVATEKNSTATQNDIYVTAAENLKAIEREKSIEREKLRAESLMDTNGRISATNVEEPQRISLPPESIPKTAIIVHQEAVSAVSVAIERGYKAYLHGDIKTAKEAYAEALGNEPYQRDALLGAAAVAVREGRQNDALVYYQQRLARDPKDEFAQAGVIALSANGGSNTALESELNQLLREYPDATHLHFLKGSLSANRQDWPSAQSAFFEAWQRDNRNPDLAFNLAVALDHLRQPKEALKFYQNAHKLSSTRQASFSADVLQQRITVLGGTAE